MNHKPAISALSFAFSALLFGLFTSPAAADIYKFIDDSGVIHFSNVPADYDNEKVVKEKTRPAKQAKTAEPARDAAAPAGGASETITVSSTGGKPAYVPSCGEPLPADVPYSEIINKKCGKYGVDPTLVKSIIRAESGFNPGAVSPKGARGLMQLMPNTASDMGVTDIFDPEQNIDGGVRYLRYLLDNFSGDVELSVAAYNCGEGRVIRNGMCVPNISETRSYVKKVMRLGQNPITGRAFSRQIYKIELKDGSILFTDSPDASTGKLSLVD